MTDALPARESMEFDVVIVGAGCLADQHQF